ncbi:MAG: Bug family tripartite tricarboxylate transporter substrate binding protein [Burkholderiales bacterium]
MNGYAVAVRLLGAALSICCTGEVFAQQDYPNRPIRFIVPYSPGGSTTWTSRLVGQRLTEAWGQQVIIDNRPGASTVIGTDAAVKSKPDGYTLVYIGSALSTNHWLVKTPYDARTDIAPIASVSSYENLLAVHPSLPVTTLKAFVALAKARPGQLNYATSGYGGPTHLVVVLFNMVAGINTQAVNYKGGGPAVVDLLGGHVQFIMAVPVNIVAHVKGGRLRAIAVAGDKRMQTLPDVPSFAEGGLHGVTLPTWQGVGAPAGTPTVIVERISAEVEKLVAMPETKEKLETEGFAPYYRNPEQTAELINTNIARIGKIIKAGNIKVD